MYGRDEIPKIMNICQKASGTRMMGLTMAKCGTTLAPKEIFTKLYLKKKTLVS